MTAVAYHSLKLFILTADHFSFPDKPLWVTEFNYNDQDLETTQDFFNTSIAYLDKLTNIERYSFFGAFRSSVSNVGSNAAMLSAGGQLTDIGAWYLGEKADGISPDSKASSADALFSGRGTLVNAIIVSSVAGIFLFTIA